MMIMIVGWILIMTVWQLWLLHNLKKTLEEVHLHIATVDRNVNDVRSTIHLQSQRAKTTFIKDNKA